MSVRQPPASSLTNLSRLVLPALAAIIAILAGRELASLDRELAFVFALKQTAELATIWYLVPSAVAMSLLAFEASLRVKSKYLLFVFLQLSALGILFAWLTAQVTGTASLVASLLASTISFALGLMARSFKQAEERQTSRYFELAMKNAELNETRLLLLKQDEADRRMLASDLHDQVLNEIKLIKSKVLALPDSQPVKKDNLVSIEQSLDTAGKHIREVMESLFPSVLENLGLCSALDQLTRDTCHKNGIQGRFLKTIEDRHLEGLTKTEELLLFRLAQEALNNAAKHAQAKTIRVNLEGNDERLTLSIIDDGVGFSLKDRGESRGLRYMRLRADLIGATITWSDNLSKVQDAASKGTVVKIEVNGALNSAEALAGNDHEQN
jgi:signal transduction histidine kinase